MGRIWNASVVVVVCGCFAGLLVGGLGLPLADAGIRTDPYRLLRSDAEPYPLTPAKWLLEPHRFGDFDLHATLELGEHTAVDVLLRQIEPRIVDEQLLPFHGRFSVLRLSTAGAGPAWLDRGAALFGDRMVGHELAPGIPATLWIQGRGRMLRANVAGSWLPWHEADDEYGMLTLIARGGDAALRNLVIEPLPMAGAWKHSRWTWLGVGLLVGLMVAAAGAFVRSASWRFLAASAVLLFGVAFACHRATWPPLALAAPGAQAALLAAWGLLAAAVVALPMRWRSQVAPVVVIAVVLSVTALLHNGALRVLRAADPAEERQLDAVFGPKAGNTIAEALGQRVRGPWGVHGLGQSERCVFLLGGQLLYDRSGPEEHLEPLLTGRLRGGLGERVDVLCLPTADGYSHQQWRLFSTFFRDYRPAALVFGLTRDEAAPDPLTGVPRSSAEVLANTLVTVRRYTQDHGAFLLLFAEQGLPDELLAVLRAEQKEGVPLVIATATDTPTEIAARLADALVPALRR